MTHIVLLSFLDRSNIGNARIAGMEKDLNLDGDKYDWLLTIFYISYILFQFQAFMWKIMWVDATEKSSSFVWLLTTF